MSRVIKFRAWEISEYGNEMHYIDLYFFEGNMIREWPADNGHAFTGTYELMQFTGLTDRLGKDVYEGDIVRSRNVFAPTVHIFEVFWRSKFAGFFLKEVGKQDEQNTWVELMHGGNVTDLEVIGNIYENPELIQ